MKKIFFLLSALVLGCLTAIADTFTVSEVVYETIDGTTVKVVGSSRSVTSTSSFQVTIPATVTNPNDSKTYDVTEIAPRAFYNYKYLYRVFFSTPSKLKKIGDYAFYKVYGYNYSTYDLTIPEGVEEIGKCAFFGLEYNINYIYLPSTLRVLGEGAFCGISYSSFNGFTFSSSNPYFTSLDGSYKYFLCNTSKTTLLAMAANRTQSFPYNSNESRYYFDTIAPYACAGYAYTSNSLSIPATIKSIGKYAFAYSSGNVDLSKATLITELPEGAFYGSKRNGGIDIGAATNITSIGDYAFQNCSTTVTTIYLPPPKYNNFSIIRRRSLGGDGSSLLLGGLWVLLFCGIRYEKEHILYREDMLRKSEIASLSNQNHFTCWVVSNLDKIGASLQHIVTN